MSVITNALTTVPTTPLVMPRTKCFRIPALTPTQQCDKCDLLTNLLDSILAKIREPSESQFYSQDQLEDTLYHSSQVKELVLQWKAHVWRAEYQGRGKTSAVNSLQKDTVLIVMDWAMKFTQMKYREKQTERFGKRGMNWHVSCVLSTPTDGADKLEVKSYVHLFNSFAQESPTVYAIIMHLLKEIKAISPHITKAFAGMMFRWAWVLPQQQPRFFLGAESLPYWCQSDEVCIKREEYGKFEINTSINLTKKSLMY